MTLNILEKTILDTISYYEGTLGKSLNGYDLLFGGKKVMNGWTPDTIQIRHRCIKPRGSVTKQKIESEGFQVCEDKTWQDTFTSNGVQKTSTAAGRYQYLGWSWANTTEKLGLGFNAPMSKTNQNKAALRGVKTKRKVTDTELKNALNSLSNFKIVLEKLKEEWTSMKGALNGSYHKTVEQGWEFYKGAYEKYKNANNTGTQSNTSTNTNVTLYLDKDGKTISKFGTSTGSGDKTKFYVNIPSGNPDKILYIWPETETYISREDSWGQVPTAVRESAYIIMAAGVSSNFNDVDDMNKALKGWNSSIQVNALKKYIMGVGNRANLAVPYYISYELIGLVDPNPSFDENYFTKKANKVYMISGSQNYISANGAKIKKIQNKILSDGGFSKEETITNQSLRQWFNNYASVITTGQAPSNVQQNTNTSTCNSNPNASYLRQVMSTLNYKEKVYVSGKKKYIIPSLDTSTGCYKLKTSKGFKDGEMSNGGDIDEKLSIVSAAIFTKIKEKHPSYIVTVTGGNDKFHQGLSYNSRHKQGRGMDMIVDGASRSCTNDSKWGKVSKPGTKIQNVIDIIRSYSASGTGGKVYNKLRYIDEYCNKSSAATGDHIHFSWGTGSEGETRAELAKTEANNSQLETYNVNDLFS